MMESKKMGAELFRAIEKDQGYAFISDALEDYEDDYVIEIARSALRHARKCVDILERLIKKYSRAINNGK